MKTILNGFVIMTISLIMCAVLVGVVFGIGYVIQLMTGFNMALTVLIETGILVVSGFAYLIGIFAE
jgi:hypothetical protein